MYIQSLIKRHFQVSHVDWPLYFSLTGDYVLARFTEHKNTAEIAGKVLCIIDLGHGQQAVMSVSEIVDCCEDFSSMIYEASLWQIKQNINAFLPCLTEIQKEALLLFANSIHDMSITKLDAESAIDEARRLLYGEYVY